MHIKMRCPHFPRGYRNTRNARGKTSRVYTYLQLLISWHTCIGCAVCSLYAFIIIFLKVLDDPIYCVYGYMISWHTCSVCVYECV